MSDTSWNHFPLGGAVGEPLSGGPPVADPTFAATPCLTKLVLQGEHFLKIQTPTRAASRWVRRGSMSRVVAEPFRIPHSLAMRGLFSCNTLRFTRAVIPASDASGRLPVLAEAQAVQLPPDEGLHLPELPLRAAARDALPRRHRGAE